MSDWHEYAMALTDQAAKSHRFEPCRTFPPCGIGELCHYELFAYERCLKPEGHQCHEAPSPAEYEAQR